MEFNPENITALFILASVIAWILKILTAHLVAQDLKLSQVAETIAGMSKEMTQLVKICDQTETRTMLGEVSKSVTKIEILLGGMDQHARSD